MAETQADSGVPVSPAANQAGIEVTDSGLAGARLTGAVAPGADQTGPEVAEVQVAEEYEIVSYQSSSWPFTDEPPPTGAIHHIELWVPNLDRAITSWGWLLTALGYRMFQDWPGGRSWRAGHCYIVVEQSPARTASRHDRCRPGLNHLAFHVETRELVDRLTGEAQLHGWKLMFSDQHPFAGGPEHYAAYLENSDGYEVELVAH